MGSISLLSNAKINLFFSINALCPDNYCDISSIILPIDFGDTLTFSKINSISKASSIIEIKIHPYQPNFNPSHNTVRTAIELFQKLTGIKNIFLKVNIEKRIPIGGGFGGGSSNAVFTINALNRFYCHILSESECLKIAQEIGVDCPFFVQNCPQLAMGRGDILTPLSKSFCQNLSSYFVLIFCLPFSISTQWAYDQFKKNSIFTPNAAKMIEQIIYSANFEDVAYNAFQNLILDYYPKTKLLFESLKKSGYNPCMTGSGSGCFIIHRDRNFLELAKEIISKHLGHSRLLTITKFENKI